MLASARRASVGAGAHAASVADEPPRKRPCRRIGTAQRRPSVPTAPCQVWAYDFVFDACANGQKLKCLTVVDEYTRQCLAIDVTGTIRSERVIEVLSQLMTQHGVPSLLRSDNGPEFISPQGVESTCKQTSQDEEEKLSNRHLIFLRLPRVNAQSCLHGHWTDNHLSLM